MEALSYANSQGLAIERAGAQSLTLPFSLDPHLVAQKFKRRIAIHPAGRSPTQHWDDVKWVELARLLRTRGWQVAFLVKPAERTYWLSLTRGEFEIPVQHSLSETMGFIYESAFLIDNDSGHGQMALTLGCKLVTIDHREYPDPPWVLGNPQVYKVAPRFSFTFLQKRIWRPFLSVGDIYKVVLRLIVDNQL